MKFVEVVVLWERVEETSLRNEKTRLLAQVFAKTTPEEARLLSYLVGGRLVPLYVPVEYGMAEKSLVKALSLATDRSIAEVELGFKKQGDLGEVIGELSKERVAKLCIKDVYQKLYQVAVLNGKGSQEGKIQLLSSLLRELSPSEAKYVVRLVAGKVRLGFSDMTILDSLSWAKKGDKSDRAYLEYAYNVSSDIGMVAYKYLAGVDMMTMGVLPGVPVRPMRAERLGTFAEIVKKLGRFAVEPKLDGMRAQIHAFGKSTDQWGRELINKQNDLFATEEKPVEVKIFSRGLEDITSMFPEIVEAARAMWERAGDFVIDGEVIGVREDGSFLPFQETMKRRRKYGVEGKVGEIPVRAYIFDVLYAKARDQLVRSYKERREVLELIIGDSEVVRLTESMEIDNETKLMSKFDEAMRCGFEGLMLKKLDSHYRAGARDFAWVKYKRAHETELADTIDAVVVGAYVGKGKRSKFGVGAFLVGVREGEKVVTVAKIGTGLTDIQFEELYEKLMVRQVEVMPSEYEVPESLSPDIWVKPEIIVEIEADEITESPLHSSCYALRFPRLLRFREDKSLQEITTKDEVVKLFEVGRGNLN